MCSAGDGRSYHEAHARRLAEQVAAKMKAQQPALVRSVHELIDKQCKRHGLTYAAYKRGRNIERFTYVLVLLAGMVLAYWIVCWL